MQQLYHSQWAQMVKQNIWIKTILNVLKQYPI